MIGRIEQAILDLIEKTDLGYKIDKISSYKADFDDDIASLVKNTRRAVWVAYSGEDALDNGKIMAHFSVIVMSRNVRNEKASRFGNDTGEVGSYQIIDDIQTLLNGNDLDLESEPLKFKRTVPLLHTKISTFFTSVFALEFDVRYEKETPAGNFNLSDFLKLHTTWDLPEMTTETNLKFDTHALPAGEAELPIKREKADITLRKDNQ